MENLEITTLNKEKAEYDIINITTKNLNYKLCPKIKSGGVSIFSKGQKTNCGVFFANVEEVDLYGLSALVTLRNLAENKKSSKIKIIGKYEIIKEELKNLGFENDFEFYNSTSELP